jgi:hypothetical protein
MRKAFDLQRFGTKFLYTLLVCIREAVALFMPSDVTRITVYLCIVYVFSLCDTARMYVTLR